MRLFQERVFIPYAKLIRMRLLHAKKLYLPQQRKMEEGRLVLVPPVLILRLRSLLHCCNVVRNLGIVMTRKKRRMIGID